MSAFTFTNFLAARRQEDAEAEREPFYEASDRAGLARTATEQQAIDDRAAFLMEVYRRSSVIQVITEGMR